MKTSSAFASRAAGGVNSIELQREARHRSLMLAKKKEEQAAKEVVVRVTVHAIAAENLIAVDNRQFCMTSDPYLKASVCDIAADGSRRSGEHARTRSSSLNARPKTLVESSHM